jgi:hypothetical protein
MPLVTETCYSTSPVVFASASTPIFLQATPSSAILRSLRPTTSLKLSLSSVTYLILFNLTHACSLSRTLLLLSYLMARYLTSWSSLMSSWIQKAMKLFSRWSLRDVPSSVKRSLRWDCLKNVNLHLTPRNCFDGAKRLGVLL